MRFQKHTGWVLLMAILVAGCDGQADASDGASADRGETPRAQAAGSRAPAAADEFPGSLLSAREVSAMIGLSGLKAYPLDHTCSWVDERKQGVELRVYCLETEPQTVRAMFSCDADRGTIDPDLERDIEALISDREPVNGIGRQAWVWFNEAHEFLDVEFPASWEAEAELAGNATVEVHVDAHLGRDAAIQVLRAAVERIERRGR